MRLRRLAGIVVLLASSPALRAQRDFLTSDEVDKVREAQIPDERLKLYVLFARERIDELQKTMGQQKRGRSLMIRDLLEDYTKIIEAVDTVSDDALTRKVDVSLGTEAVQTAERNFAAQLQKLYATMPADLDLYDVAFREAIATTLDSLDQSTDDTPQRAQDLSAKEEKARQEAETILKQEDTKGRPAAAKDGEKTAQAGDDAAPAKPKRKAPTLLRPGETTDTPSR